MKGLVYLGSLASENTAGIKISAIKEMAVLSSKVKDAVYLAWGLPSFRAPQYIRHGSLVDTNFRK